MAGRVRIGTIAVDVVDRAGALSAIDALVAGGLGGTVFTPNVDHVVRAAKDRAFRAAYARTRLALPDGAPVVWTARLSGYALRERITGADLFMPLLRHAAERGWGVYLLGGRVGASEKLIARIARELPQLRVTGVGPATRELTGDPTRLTRLDAEVAAIKAARPELVLVCLGSPLQELWSDEVAAAVAPALLFGLGSAMDVAAGMLSRAPPWLQRNGLEWLYRLASEPRRLWRRYLVDDVQFAPIFVRTVLRHRARRQRDDDAST
jgi:N-acetylglucosaminyldiphosphoundecaprenol N-acetyl-beta-D-mannosaminyltransferase